MGNRTRSTEVELKLLLPDENAIPTILKFLRQRGYKLEDMGPVKNVDTYLDTFDWTLMKNHLALRHRQANDKAMYTLKSVGGMEDGVATRAETEIVLDQPVSDLTIIPIKSLKNQVKELIYPRKLIEHVQVRTDRHLYHAVSPRGAKIELAFDATGFSARGLHEQRTARRLMEMEAELLSGPVKEITGLRDLLKEKFEYAPSAESKLEVAIKRLKIVIPSKKVPESLKVRLDDRLDLAVRKILSFQFQWFTEQIPGVLRDIDTEFVHQGRVATRRMRSALKLFHEALPEITTVYLEEELKWLGGMFGAVRDLDVFLLNLPKFRTEIKPFPKKQKKGFDDWIEKHRRKPLKALCDALESVRARRIEQRMKQFLERPLPKRPRGSFAAMTVACAAPKIIHEKLAAVVKQGHAVIQNPKLKEFHGLRIQMKRLRYACEFVAPAYDGGLDAFIDRTVDIQDCLGELQDTVFTRKFVRWLHNDSKTKLVDPDMLFTLGQIHELQAQIARNKQDAFAAIWEEFSSDETRTTLEQVFRPSSEQ
ncbi:MAG TPA: CHAD domain-containing protein [Syntrophorhabdaceae bacterium]|nr:CHAD domain-containing protein [Syntrophorhabdaceae bacterium]